MFNCYQIVDNKLKMSYIIDNAQKNYFYNFSRRGIKKKASSQQRCQNQLYQENRYNFVHLQQGLRLKHVCFTHNYGRTPQQLSITTLQTFKTSPRFMAALTFSEEYGRGLRIKVVPLSNYQMYHIVQTSQNRNLINRKIAFRQERPFPFKISINLFNGQLTLSLPPFLLDSSKITTSGLTKRTILLHQLIDQTLIQAYIIFEWALWQNNKDSEIDRKPRRIWQQLDRLWQILNVFKRVNEGAEVMTQKTIRGYKLKEMNSVKRFLQRKTNCSQHLVHSTLLFNSYEHFLSLNCQEECQLTPQELHSIQRLTLPSRKMFQESQSASLLTHIFINKPQQSKIVKKIAVGGFSSIFLAEIQFCFVNPIQFRQKKLDFKQNRWNRNLFVIKKDGSSSKGKNRIMHQLSIIQKLKNSLSPLLPRYFAPVNNSQNDVVMQYIPFPTLKQFLLISRQSLSLHTKLILMLNLVQGVRSLARQEVIHLDIKPNNVMLSPDYQIKLLDFGESYHPDIKSRPGNTVPYSCPEVYIQNEQFTVKSDVYSLGVVLFEILYHKHPFFLHLPQSLKKYKTEEYLHHWLDTPESKSQLFESRVHCYLNQMISRCLSPDPLDRPQLIMIGLVLVECLRALECG